MACEAEVAAAANWFAEELFEPNEQRTIFCTRLQELLIARYRGHWYPDEPHRGCAFRALLSTINSLDPLLLRAADSTGHRGLQESFMRQFSDAGEVTCWVRQCFLVPLTLSLQQRLRCLSLSVMRGPGHTAPPRSYCAR